jgi:hypothetical protein
MNHLSQENFTATKTKHILKDLQLITSTSSKLFGGGRVAMFEPYMKAKVSGIKFFYQGQDSQPLAKV